MVGPDDDWPKYSQPKASRKRRTLSDQMTVNSHLRICDTERTAVQRAENPPIAHAAYPAGRFALPADCQRIVIVGAGGFGREVLQWAREAWPDHASLVGGFLSDDPGRLTGFLTDVGILSAVRDYRPAAGDYLLLAIGVPYARRQVAESLLAKQARFLTLVHPRALVAPTALIGEGSIVCPFAIVSDAAVLGSFVLANYNASLGHDSAAGEYAVLSPYATLGGGARIDDEVFLGLHASVGPGISIGARSKVSANSCALASAPSDSLVFGVPGRILQRISVVTR